MLNRQLKYFFWALLCVFNVAANAQDIKSIGVPYIQNFPKAVYQSGNQNWSITRDKKGVTYFGNAQGLLSYDGKYWQQYQMPNRQIVRAVAAANGVVYAGGFGEFGYWSDQNGKLIYTSLIQLIPKPYRIKDEIWKIYTDQKRVIFHSFTSIFIYENQKITVVRGANAFLFLHQAGNKFYAEVLGKGLFELKGNTLEPLTNTGNIVPSNVLSILPYKNGELLVGTSKDGLLVYNGENFSPLNTLRMIF